MSAVFAKAKETSGFRGLKLAYQPGGFLPSDLAASARGAGDVALPLQTVDLSKIKPLTPMQEKQLEMDFARDVKLTSEFQAAINAHVGTAPAATRAAFTDPNVAPKASMVDKKALNSLAKESADTRGIPLGVAVRLLGIVKDVIMRFIKGKDHGLHATSDGGNSSCALLFRRRSQFLEPDQEIHPRDVPGRCRLLWNSPSGRDRSPSP